MKYLAIIIMAEDDLLVTSQVVELSGPYKDKEVITEVLNEIDGNIDETEISRILIVESGEATLEDLEVEVGPPKVLNDIQLEVGV